MGGERYYTALGATLHPTIFHAGSAVSMGGTDRGVTDRGALILDLPWVSGL